MPDYRGRDPFEETSLDEQIDAVFEDWRANLVAVALWLGMIACGVVAAIEAGIIRW